MSLTDPTPPPVVIGSSQPVFDPYYEWLSIPPEEQPPDHYRLLGLMLYEENCEVISNAADRQATHLRSFQLSEHASDSEKLLAEVFKARACLLDFDRKTEYDQELKSQLAALTSSTVLPVITQRTRRRRRRKKKSASWEMVKIVLGGIAGSILAVLILWYGFGKDPLWIMAPNKTKLRQVESPRSERDTSDQIAERSKTESNKSKKDVLVERRKIVELNAGKSGLKKGLATKSSEKTLDNSGWIDILKLVDVDKHAVLGTWIRNGDEIISKPAIEGRIGIPIVLDGSYELSVDFTRHSGREAVSVMLPLKNTDCYFLLGGWTGRVTGIGMVDGRLPFDFSENHERGKRFQIQNNQRYHWDISVTVHGDSVTIESKLDDKPMLVWSGKLNRLSCFINTAMPNRNMIGLGAFDINCTFHRVELRLLDSK